MGEVYKARDTRLNRTVAIKVLPEDFSLDADRRQRFEREARLVASLSHPNICALHDVGTESSSSGESARAYIVMEFLEEKRSRIGSLAARSRCPTSFATASTSRRRFTPPTASTSSIAI